MIAHIKFPYKQCIIFSRHIILSQPSMKIKSYSYCESKQIDCELGTYYKHWKISKLLTKAYHYENNEMKTFTSWESLNVLLSWRQPKFSTSSLMRYAWSFKPYGGKTVSIPQGTVRNGSVFFRCYELMPIEWLCSKRRIKWCIIPT